VSENPQIVATLVAVRLRGNTRKELGRSIAKKYIGRIIGAGSANFATENSNAPVNGARRLHLETELRELLLKQGQDLFLIFEDGVQAALVFQDGALILFDGVLVGLDLLLVGDDRLLITENLFLISDDGALGHIVCAPPDVA
jgi:hypothetical protein